MREESAAFVHSRILQNSRLFKSIDTGIVFVSKLSQFGMKIINLEYKLLRCALISFKIQDKTKQNKKRFSFS